MLVMIITVKSIFEKYILRLGLVVYLVFATSKSQSQVSIFYNDASLYNIAVDVKHLVEESTGQTATLSVWTNENYGLQLFIDATVLPPVTNCGVSETMNSTCSVSYTSWPQRLEFRAPYWRGIQFGIYQYLEADLGFRFYLPDASDGIDASFRTAVGGTSLGNYPEDLWTKIPSISSSNFLKDPTHDFGGYYYPLYKYHHTSIGSGAFAGSYNRINQVKFDWDLWNARNGLYSDVLDYSQKPGYYFGNPYPSGHTQPYTLNYCDIALYREDATHISRNPGRSKPDINSSGVFQKYADNAMHWYADIISSFPNDPYYSDVATIAVQDGEDWGNADVSEDPIYTGCASGTSTYGTNYPSASDQNMILANQTASLIFNSTSYSTKPKKLQTDAYSIHIDPPSSGISIHEDLEISMAPDLYGAAYSSTGTDLRTMWLDRMSGSRRQLGEYYYYNDFRSSLGMPFFLGRQGMTDMLNWHNMDNYGSTPCRSLGLYIETQCAKFTPAFLLQAYNRFLKDNSDVTTTYDDFFSEMFGTAGPAIKDLFTFWEKDYMMGGLQSKYYLLRESFRLLNEAADDDMSTRVQWRITELKAWFHFMRLMFEFDKVYVPRGTCTTCCLNSTQISDIAAKFTPLATYLVQIMSYKIVNSYGIITYYINDMTPPTPSNTCFSSLLSTWDMVNNGSTLAGSYPPLDPSDIDYLFTADLSALNSEIPAMSFAFMESSDIPGQMWTDGKIMKNEIIAASTDEGISDGASFMVFNTEESNSKKIYLRDYLFTSYTQPRPVMPDQHFTRVVLERVDKSWSTHLDIQLSQSGGGDLYLTLPSYGEFVLTFFTKIHGIKVNEMTIDPDDGVILYQTGYQQNPHVVGTVGDPNSDYNHVYIPDVDRVYLYNEQGFLAWNHRPVFITPEGCQIRPIYDAGTNYKIAYFNVPHDDKNHFWGVSANVPVIFINISNKFFFFSDTYSAGLAAPALSVSPSTVCVGSNFTLSASPPTGVTYPTGTTYHWEHQSGQYTAQGANPNISALLTHAGYWICYVTDALGNSCTSTDALIGVVVEDCDTECTETENITSPISGAQIRSVSNYITASSTVTVSSGEILYKAGNYILLESGFETSVSGSGIFQALIEECESSGKGNFTQHEKPKDVSITDAKVYPNPFNHNINYSVELSPEDKQIGIELINANGAVIYKSNTNTFSKGFINSYIDPGPITAGIYFMIIRTSKKTYQFKLVKQ